MANLHNISHSMVGALRHGHSGASVDEAGWMPVATLVALPHFVSLGASQELIQRVTRRERKKRFEIEDQAATFTSGLRRVGASCRV